MQVHMCESVHMCRLAHAHSLLSRVQFLQVSLFHYYEIGLLSQSDIKVSQKKNYRSRDYSFVLCVF